MSTVTLLNKHVFAQKNARMNLEQRGFYFIVGFGSIVATLANMPESTFLMAVINVLGIGLVTLSILGKRLFSTRKESGLSFEPKQLSCIATGMTGLTLSIATIAIPPASLMLAFYLHAMAILLVTHAILDANSFLKQKSKTQIQTLPTDENKKSDLVVPLNKAA